MKASDKAYSRIQDMIVAMEIKPGENLTVNALSERLNIGATPIREALTKLESEGYVYSSNGRKTVHMLTVEQLKEIFDVKAVLEPAVGRWAAERGNSQQRKEMKKLISRMLTLTHQRPDSEDRMQYLDKWLTLDKKLHHLIFEMANCPTAEKIIQRLNIQWHRARISLYILEGRIARSAKEHEEFSNFIIEGKGEEAERSMRNHMLALVDEIEHVMKLFNYPVNR